MRRSVGGKRRDANEPAIVQALRALGCRVFHLSGAGLPDVLVRLPGPTARWTVLEIKSARGRLTPLQEGSEWPVVRTVDEALAAIWR